MENNLRNLLEQLRLHHEASNRHEFIAALRTLMDNRRDYFRQGMEETALLEGFADGLYKTLLLELDEEEEESIETAELAYIALCRLINSDSATPEHYKQRLLLLHYFNDYFTDSIIEVFLAAYRKEHLLQARNLALECIDKMQLADMFHLEEHEPDFIEGDEQIADACNAIETDPDLSDEERRNAALLHKVLYAYLKAKYKTPPL